MKIPSVTVEELATRLEASSAASAPVFVVDVRDDRAWGEHHIDHPAVHHVPMALLPEEIESLPHDADIFVLCQVGESSRRVAAFLEALGFRAHNVEGGMAAWVENTNGGRSRHPLKGV